MVITQRGDMFLNWESPATVCAECGVQLHVLLRQSGRTRTYVYASPAWIRLCAG